MHTIDHGYTCVNLAGWMNLCVRDASGLAIWLSVCCILRMVIYKMSQNIAKMIYTDLSEIISCIHVSLCRHSPVKYLSFHTRHRVILKKLRSRFYMVLAGMRVLIYIPGLCIFFPPPLFNATQVFQITIEPWCTILFATLYKWYNVIDDSI